MTNWRGRNGGGAYHFAVIEATPRCFHTTVLTGETDGWIQCKSATGSRAACRLPRHQRHSSLFCSVPTGTIHTMLSVTQMTIARLSYVLIELSVLSRSVIAAYWPSLLSASIQAQNRVVVRQIPQPERRENGRKTPATLNINMLVNGRRFPSSDVVPSDRWTMHDRST